ncbi:MAG: hypothetical protein QF535_04505 [Anaerolineales bacterium]|nr:hypothetical protein [Anaerolineales bacterium]
MNAWRVKAWRWKMAIEKIEFIVDKLDGLASIGAIAEELIALTGTKRYQKLHESNRLGYFVMASVKRSKTLKLIPYFNHAGDKEYVVIRERR